MGDAGNVDTSSRKDTPSSCFKSNITLSFPKTDIVSFAMAHVRCFDPQHVIFAEASDPRNRVLAGEVVSKVESMVTKLKLDGLQAGDCVCIHSYNSIWYPLLWLAVIAAGGVVTGSNPAHTSAELTHHLKITNAKFIVTQKICAAAVKEAVLKGDVSVSNILILGTTGDLSGIWFNSAFDALLYTNDDISAVSFDDSETQDNTIAVYAATSGTTGLPKAAELSHKYLVSQASLLEDVFSKRRDEMRQLVCLPVFHAFAAQLSIILPLRLGITTYFMPRFTLREYTHYVAQFQITDSPVVPPIISALLVAQRSSLESLRYLVCAGAPMTASVQNKLYSNLHPLATIAQCWGTTELGWITCFSPNERDESGSVGQLLPNTLLKLTDCKNNPITVDNVPGEACIRSPSVFKRYRGSQSANTHAFDGEGFYHTGDLAYICNGKVFICGRIKDILKVNGWQVSPEEIERVILELDGVSDCVVTGYTVIGSCGLEETKPRAFVVRRQGFSVSEAEIKEHVAKSLVRYKHLCSVMFIQKVQRSATGKILRRMVVEADIAKDCVTAAKSGHQEPGLFRYHLVVTVLIPLASAFGLPGFILLMVVFRQSLAHNGRHV